MRQVLLPLMVLSLVAGPSAGQRKRKSTDQAPHGLYAMSLAADPGKTTRLTIRGLRLDAAAQVRVGEPKSTGKIVGKGRKVPVPNQLSAQLIGDTEVDIEVTLPAEVPGGGVPVSLVNADGDGKPFDLLVNDDTPRVQEKEPNDGFRQPMPVAAPVVVQAAFRQGQDVDVYRLDGRAGQKWRIEVQARRFGSPADPMLTLYDGTGHLIAHGDARHDGLDRVLRVTLPRDGPYLVSVVEAFDQGGPMFVYRLAIRADK